MTGNPSLVSPKTNRSLNSLITRHSIVRSTPQTTTVWSLDSTTMRPALDSVVARLFPKFPCWQDFFYKGTLSSTQSPESSRSTTDGKTILPLSASPHSVSFKKTELQDPPTQSPSWRMCLPPVCFCVLARCHNLRNSLLASIIHLDCYSAVPNFERFGYIFSLNPANIDFMAT